MSSETIQSNTKLSAIKNHFVPSVVTSAMALMVAIPVTAALSSGAGSVVGASPVLTKSCDVSTDEANSPVNTVRPAVSTASVHRVVTNTNTNTGTGNGNSGNNNGSTNTNGSGNGNGSGANANGNTQSNVGGLIGGVNAIVPVSALNGSLNDVASHNTVDVAPTVTAVTNLATNVLGGLGL
jgi:hypothetical protein